MTTPLAVVLGASREDPPPGLADADGPVRVSYAPDPAALANLAEESEILFFWRAARSWLEDEWPRLGRLRWIQTASDGVDGLLFPDLVNADVTVTNARGVFDDPIAEWAIAAFLSFATGFHRSTVDTAARRWQDERTRPRVEGSTLCVIGPGPIGRAAARRARDLGIHVRAVGRAPRADELFGRIVGTADLLDALDGADFVLDALPLAPGTGELVDAAAFAAMKPGAIFANVGRGGTVHQEALIAALATGHLGGAALDVFVEEPLPSDSPLWGMPNVVVSPHVCGDVHGWEQEVVALFVDNLFRYARAEPLRNVVDKTAGFGAG